MSTTTLLANNSDISTDDYCVFGLATCFLKSRTLMLLLLNINTIKLDGYGNVV